MYSHIGEKCKRKIKVVDRRTWQFKGEMFFFEIRFPRISLSASKNNLGNAEGGAREVTVTFLLNPLCLSAPAHRHTPLFFLPFFTFVLLLKEQDHNSQKPTFNLQFKLQPVSLSSLQSRIFPPKHFLYFPSQRNCLAQQNQMKM